MNVQRTAGRSAIARVGGRFLIALMLAATAAPLGAPGPVSAAFPGSNGQIAFQSSRASGNYDIWTMAADGTGATRLTSDPAEDADPAFSPDGSKIAFLRYAGGNNLYVMNADGSGQTRLATGYDPAWTPDGRISYVYGGNIWTMNGDGTNQQLSIADGTHPAWSPDGTKVAFVRGVNLVIAAADGSGPTQVATYADDPAWAPDSSKVVFTGWASPKGIYTVKADGTALTALTQGYSYDYEPAFSPDGSRVVFTSGDRVTGPESNYELFEMGADGSSPTRLTNEFPAYDAMADWGPGVAAPALPYSATLASPLGGSPVTVEYSDTLTASGTVTCNKDCPSGTVNVPVELQLRGGSLASYTTVTRTTVPITFTQGVAKSWSFTWQAGRYTNDDMGTGPVHPGTYDARVLLEFSIELIVLGNGTAGQGAVVVTREDTTSAWGGPTSGHPGDLINLSASVADADGGTGTGNGLFSLDPYLQGQDIVRFTLYQGACPLGATPAQVGLSVYGSIDAAGAMNSTPQMTLPSSAGSYCIESGYLGNTYYAAGSDFDTITVNSATAYTIDGIYQPIDNVSSGLVNGAKGGATVPIRFNVLLGGVIQSDTSVVTTIVEPIRCEAAGGIDMLQPSELGSGSTTLKFDPMAQQMIFSWKTPKSAGCYLVTISVSGGAEQSAKFQLR